MLIIYKELLSLVNNTIHSFISLDAWYEKSYMVRIYHIEGYILLAYVPERKSAVRLKKI